MDYFTYIPHILEKIVDKCDFDCDFDLPPSNLEMFTLANYVETDASIKNNWLRNNWIRLTPDYIQSDEKDCEQNKYNYKKNESKHQKRLKIGRQQNHKKINATSRAPNRRSTWHH